MSFVLIMDISYLTLLTFSSLPSSAWKHLVGASLGREQIPHEACQSQQRAR